MESQQQNNFSYQHERGLQELKGVTAFENDHFNATIWIRIK